MNVIKTEVFTFDELSDKAKEKAREWYRDGAFNYEWWDCVEETIKTAGECLGIRVDKLYFSGFWSQGDGACFEGAYYYKKGWRKALRAEFGKGEMLEELEQIGKDLQDVQKPSFYMLSASVKHRGHYSHEYCTEIDADVADESDRTTLEDTLRDFMRWSYRLLESEYEFLNSDESVDESIKMNEYTFTESGKRFG